MSSKGSSGDMACIMGRRFCGRGLQLWAFFHRGYEPVDRRARTWSQGFLARGTVPEICADHCVVRDALSAGVSASGAKKFESGRASLSVIGSNSGRETLFSFLLLPRPKRRHLLEPKLTGLNYIKA